MISHDPIKIHQIIHSGEELRDKHLESVQDQVARYHGPWFYGRGPEVEDQYDPQNLAYQFISLTLPVLAWDNPRFEVKTKRGPTVEPVAIALKHALDRWAVDTDLQETLEAVAMDYLFAYGVLLTEMEPTPDQDPTRKDPMRRPVINRLDPRRYGMDPFADNPRDTRLQWHTWARDKDDLLQEAKDFPDRGWNVDAIQRTAPDAGLEKMHRDPNTRNAPMRQEIVGYQVWIPEWDLDEIKSMKPAKRKLFHGTLCDIAVSGQFQDRESEGVAQFIREPRPFYGPSWGPYSVVGAYKVPGKLYPLGPLTAVEGQTRELNEHSRNLLRSARTRKKIGLATDKDPSLSEIITDTREGEVAVASMENLDRNFKEIELGGVTAEQRLTVVALQADADSALGMSDAKKGEVTGIGTATENAIADAAGNQRLSWQKKKFRKPVIDASRTAAWYIWNGEDVEIPLGDEAAGAMGMPGQDISFKGGQEEPEPTEEDPRMAVAGSKLDFDDLEIGIEIMSTERLDEGVAQARAVQLLTMLGQAVPGIAMAPMAGWTEAFDLVGESLNMPGLGEKLGIARVQGAAMQGQLPTQQAEQAAQQSRMTGDSAPPAGPRQPPPSVKKGGVAPSSAPQKAQNQKAKMAGVGA